MHVRVHMKELLHRSYLKQYDKEAISIIQKSHYLC